MKKQLSLLVALAATVASTQAKIGAVTEAATGTTKTAVGGVGHMVAHACPVCGKSAAKCACGTHLKKGACKHCGMTKGKCTCMGGCAGKINGAGNGHVAELSGVDCQNLIKSQRFVVVHFFKSGCGKCAQVAEAFADEAPDFAGKVSFAKVNFANNQQFAKQYNVSSTPTILFFKDGQVKSVFKGAIDDDKLERRIERKLGVSE